MPGRCRRGVRGSGDIWGAEPFIDKEHAVCYVGLFFFFWCQLFSPDPITVQLSGHLPVHQVTKYKHTNHAIVVQRDTTVHTVGIVFSRNIVKYRIFLLSSAVKQADEASTNCANFIGLINIHGEFRSSQNEYSSNVVCKMISHGGHNHWARDCLSQLVSDVKGTVNRGRSWHRCCCWTELIRKSRAFMYPVLRGSDGISPSNEAKSRWIFGSPLSLSCFSS